MGCSLCKNNKGDFLEDLDIDEVSEANSLPEIPNLSNKSKLSHHLLKESMPIHCKMAVDKGNYHKQNKAEFNSSQDHKLCARSKLEMSKKILEEQKLKEYSSTPSLLPQIDIAFDSSCIILENKSSVYNRYTLAGIIGRGTYGEVHKIQHNLSKKIFAMKIIKRNSLEESKNIINEIEILKNLDHPNIVRLYEFSHDTTHNYLVTELCEGGELLNYLAKRHSFSEHLAAKIMVQLLSAVHYCHLRHIMHRDIKPENLVLESNDVDSNLKVIDFGTSTLFRPNEKFNDIKGTR